MSAIIQNEAAWIPTKNAKCQVGPGQPSKPAENEVVIEVAYAAVNPIDHLIQDYSFVPVSYPTILGTDVSGKIVQLGSQITRFKIGQRVIGQCDILFTGNPTHAAFQRFVTCQEIMVAVVPDSVPLANAAVIPLCYTTAACALFKHLKLPLPSIHPEPVGKRILLWGGSSSIGCAAIQLAVAAGLTVVTTASPPNHDLVKSLGATYVFDHNDPKVVDEISKLLLPDDYVLDCISSPATQQTCMKIVSDLGGGIFPVLRWPAESKYPNVEPTLVIGGDPVLVDLDLGDAIWRRYLPEALDAGKFVPKPDPEIIKGGLEKVQEGIDILRKGVSAKKIVIEIAKKA